MKKTIIYFMFLISGFGLIGIGCTPRQSPVNYGGETSTTGMTENIRVPGPSSFEAYEGRYRVENAQFEYLTIRDENDQLRWHINEEYNGVLQPGTVQDQFMVPSTNSKATFIRNNDNEVTGIRIEYNGTTYTGQKVD